MRHALLLALVACGVTPQGPATQAGSGSATGGRAAAPLTAPDVKSEDVSTTTTQEPKPVTAAATVLANANDSFEYKVGNPNFHGRTIVRVTGDGNAEASFERGGTTQRYKGTAPAAKLKALRASLTKHPIDRYKPAKRTPVPDEATMEFVLVTGSTRTEASYSNGDRFAIEPLDELVEVIQDIASKVSGGKIEY